MLDQKQTVASRNVVIGALVGGILGFLIAVLVKTGSLNTPGIRGILGMSPLNVTLTGAVLGLVIGGVIGSLTRGRTEPSQVSEEVLNKDTNVIIKLKEEQLDITKKQIQTGDVSLHKELVKEEKTITVPVTREELVIEKKVFDHRDPDHVAEQSETIRIPISEERIEVSKHRVLMNDVSVHKHKFEETKHLKENLKKEQVHVETTGHPKSSDKNC